MAPRRLNPETPAQAFQRRIKGDRVMVAAFKIAFGQENRIRALEGKAPLTAAAFKARWKTQFEAGA